VKRLHASLVALVMTVGGCSNQQPERSPHPLVSASVPTPGEKTPLLSTAPSVVPSVTNSPTERPTSAPSGPPGPPIVDLPLSRIRSVTLPAEFRQLNEVNDFDAYGQDAVYVELNGRTAGRGQQVWHVDLANGVVEPLNEPATSVVTLTPRISGTDIVWTADADGPQASVKWRIMHYDLDTRTTNVVAEGVNTRLDGGSADTPTVDVNAGMVAYTEEAPRPGHPMAWRIVIKRLSDGSTVRSFESDSSIWDLSLSNEDVLFSQGTSDQQSQQVTDTAVYLSTAASPDPALIAPAGFSTALDGQRMVWDGLSGSATAPGLWTKTYTDHSSTLISSPLAEAADRFPAAGDGFVSWDEEGADWSYLSVWDSAAARAFRIFGFGDAQHTGNTQIIMSSPAGGSLTWGYETNSRQTFGIQSFSTISLEDLAAALTLAPR
jgi:hypothetical protein